MNQKVFDPLFSLFERFFGEPAQNCEPIKAHASERQIYRLSSGSNKAIGIFNNDFLENRAFVYFTEHFRSLGLPVPQIYGTDLERSVYLQQDLGSETLYSVLEHSRTSDNEMSETCENLFTKALKYLPEFQVLAGRSLDYSMCYPRQVFDDESVLYDMEMFRKEFLGRLDIRVDDSRLKEDFYSLAAYVSQSDKSHFMYRDFQTRNIMVQDDDLYFIDYQGGRRGPLQYDVASILYQSKAKLSLGARQRLLEAYLKKLEQLIPVSRREFYNYFDAFLLLRLMQVLGTYGTQGLALGKQYFLESIPLALKNLEEHLYALRWLGSELKRVLEEVVNRNIRGDLLSHG